MRVVRTTLAICVLSTLLATPSAAQSPFDTCTVTQIDSRYNRYPRISADGSRVSFESTMNLNGGNPDGNNEIFFWDRNTGVITQVSEVVGSRIYYNNNDPRISANGQRIAYTQSIPMPGQPLGIQLNQVRVYDIPTGATIALAPPPTASSTSFGEISADGTKVFTSIAGGRSQIVYYDLAAGTQTSFFGSYFQHALSADGTRFAAARLGGGVVIFDVATATQTLIPGSTGLNPFPRISGDGKWVVYVSNGNPVGRNVDGSNEIFLYDVEHASVRQVTDLLTGYVQLGSISGDGNVIAFHSSANITGQNADGNTEIFLYDVDTATFKQLTVTPTIGYRISSSPNLNARGDFVAFTSEYDLAGTGVPVGGTSYVTCAGNARPVVDAGGNQSLPANGACEATFTLAGSATDPNNDPIGSYEWSGPFGTLEGASVAATLGLGSHDVTLTATDARGGRGTARVRLTVTDDTPPAFTSTVPPIVLPADGPGGTPYVVPLPTAEDGCGPATVTSDAPGIFPIGTTTVTFTARDAAGNEATATTLVTVRDINTNPTANAGNDATVNADGTCAATVTLNGSGSDADGDPLTYTWTGPFGTVTGAQPQVTLGLGTHTLTLTVQDGRGGSASDTVTITVVDATAPVIAAVTATPSVIVAANHALVPVQVQVVATDGCGGSVTCRIVAVTSNEPENGLGDGNTSTDWQITGPLTLLVRAERSGKGSGRVYSIRVECTDAAGNRSTSIVTVTVPHSMKK